MIEVRKLRKVFPRTVEAVNGIDFDVTAGEVFGLLGPNGAGMSTTVGMLTRTTAPTSGTARVGGFDVATQPLLARAVSSVVVPCWFAVPHHGAAGWADLDREVPAADVWAGVDAVRPARRRQWAAQHLEDRQHIRCRRVEPRRAGGVRRRPHGRVDSRLHPLGSALGVSNTGRNGRGRPLNGAWHCKSPEGTVVPRNAASGVGTVLTVPGTVNRL